MKLPSLFPAGFFAGGILLAIALKNFVWPGPRSFLLTAILLLLFGFVALRKNRAVPAALLAAGAWIALGMAALSLERSSVSSNLAETLIEAGKLDSSTALRWRGRLRDDPLQVPWGSRFEINLEEVESVAGTTPVAGGMRLTYYSGELGNSLPPAAR